jgi:hypothetical protein
MTVEADLYTTLKGLVGNRVFPDLAPAGTARPYIVYQEISGEAPVFLEQANPSKKNGRFQIVVWSVTRAEASAISLQIESAMVLATLFQAKPIGGRTAVYDEETELRGARQDYSVWSDR